MAKLNKPSSVKVTPKDGELEITININISLDDLTDKLIAGLGIPSVDGCTPIKTLAAKKDNDKVDLMVPDFGSIKVDFGK